MTLTPRASWARRACWWGCGINWRGAGSSCSSPPGGAAGIATLRITVRGAAGHGAAPHRGVDAIVAAASAVVGLQHIVSRRLDPQEPVVVTIGTFHAGVAPN